jgi:hypothetical protein
MWMYRSDICGDRGVEDDQKVSYGLVMMLELRTYVSKHEHHVELDVSRSWLLAASLHDKGIPAVGFM